jgi:hypothetical protein
MKIENENFRMLHVGVTTVIMIKQFSHRSTVEGIQ